MQRYQISFFLHCYVDVVTSILAVHLVRNNTISFSQDPCAAVAFPLVTIWVSSTHKLKEHHSRQFWSWVPFLKDIRIDNGAIWLWLSNALPSLSLRTGNFSSLALASETGKQSFEFNEKSLVHYSCLGCWGRLNINEAIWSWLRYSFVFSCDTSRVVAFLAKILLRCCEYYKWCTPVAHSKNAKLPKSRSCFYQCCICILTLEY